MNGHLKHLKIYPAFYSFVKILLTFAGGVVEDDLFASDVDDRLSRREFSRKEKKM